MEGRYVERSMVERQVGSQVVRCRPADMWVGRQAGRQVVVGMYHSVG